MRLSVTGWTELGAGRRLVAALALLTASALATAQQDPQSQPLPPPPPAQQQPQPQPRPQPDPQGPAQADPLVPGQQQPPAQEEIPLQPRLPVLPLPQPIELEESSRWTRTLERISTGVIAIQIDAARAFDTEWNTSSQATGFVVDAERGIVLTNRHVVTPGPVKAFATFLNREEVELVPVYRDPVHDFLVDRRAQRRRKAAIPLERRLGAAVPDQLLGQPIQIGRRHPGRDRGLELGEHHGHELVRRPQALDLRSGSADNHDRPPVTDATAAAMSAATESGV